MKPKLLIIPHHPLQSFSIRKDTVPFFYKELHLHPEIELVYIIKGSGTQFIGNNIGNFQENDMIMVGSNTPHLWKCDPSYFEGKDNYNAVSTVIHFLPDVFGDTFFNIPENKMIQQLFEKAKSGIIINGVTKIKIATLLEQLLSSLGTQKVILLLEILDLLANDGDIISINKTETIYLAKGKETKRMNDIYQYLLNHFTEAVSLDVIAKTANLSKNAFCRYFKQRTKKTFSYFLLELRVNYACKLLIDTEKKMNEVCYESGFNNISNFNKYFKKIRGITPNAFKKSFN